VTLDGTVDTTVPTGAGGYESGEWEYTFVNLPKTDLTSGADIAYTASEAELEGWTDSVDGTTVTNTPDDKKVVDDDEAILTIKKVDSITGNVIPVEGVEFTLTPTDPAGEAQTFTTDADGTITISFEGDETTAVNVAKTGTYTLEETGAPEGYTASSQTYTVTANEELVSISLNSDGIWEWLYNLIVGANPDFEDGVLTVPNTPNLISVDATKVWNDNGNKDNKRPSDVTFQLYKTVNGTTTAVENRTADLSGDGNTWTTTFTNLPEYEDGYKVTYTVDETEVPEGYTKSISSDGLTITNSYQSEPVKEVFTGTSTTNIDGEVVEPGQELTYQITYTNTTGKTATTVTVEDELPAHTTFKSTEATLTGSETHENGVVTWTFADIEDGTEIVVTIVVTVDDDVDGEVLKNDSVVNDGENSYNSNEVTNPTPPDVPSSPTGEGNLTVTKELTGRALKAGEFSFTLTPVGSAPGSKQTKTNAADGTVAFDEISFIKTGTFEYTIDEVEGDLGGVTYDESTYTAVATVTQDTSDPTKLIVEWSIKDSDSDEIVFENIYKATGDAELTVSKSLAGAAWPGDKELTLTLSGQGGTLPDDTTVVLTDEGDATFGKITYDESDAGQTYTYTISEDGFGDGWTGSGDVTATVEVTDNGDGTLSTEVTYSPEDATITNTYEAEGEAIIEVNKAVAGAAWPAGKTLTLTLSGQGGTLPDTKTVSLTEAGKATFDAIKYTEADAGKTYTYTISEDGFGDGWTGSGDVTATVEVTDNGDGTLSTEVTYDPEDATIVNTYEATGDITLSASKELVGREWKDGEKFTFTLVGPDGAVVDTKDVSSNSTVSFETIEYDESDAGKTYEYTIRETSELPGGVTQSGDITATVTVTDNGNGTLATSVTYTKDDKIVNTYTATPVKAQIKVKKTISGFISGEDPYGNVVDRTFTVKMTPVDGAPMPEGKDELSVDITTSGGVGTGTFDEIVYTFDDMKDDSGKQLTTKDFEYEVVETGTAPNDGWTFDENHYTVKVTVEDDQNGKLKVTKVTQVDDSANVEIVNTFKETSAEVTLHVDKVIDDQSDSAQDATFTFTLTPIEGTEGEQQTIEITTNGLTGGADFSKLTFDKAGTYKYTIQEKVEGEVPEGWTYDTKEYPVVITVNDNFEVAILEGNTTIDGETTTSLTITNIYKATETTSNLEVTKAVNDVSGSAPSITFEFTLTPIDGAPMPDDGTSTASVTGSGTATFSAITYEKKGEYKYTIQEQVEGEVPAGWTYDTSAYDVIVTVVDDGGHLVASAVYGAKQETSLTVTNKYEPEPAVVTLSARKVVKVDPEEGHAPNASFTFNLIDPSGEVIERQTIENGGYVDFETELEFAKVGTYTYQIQEIDGGAKGFTYDTAAHNAVVTVTDPHKDGVLEATVKYDDSDELVITNTFTVDPVWIDPPVKKVVKGNPKTDETFTFQMKALTEGAPMPAGSDGNVKTMTITGSGEKEFGRIDYYAAGTYTYQISEVAGSAKGYTYDNTVYTITVEVTENEDGSLSKTETITGGDGKIVFTNEYKATPGKKKMPKTGDSNPLGLVAVLLGLGGTALVAAGATRRRRERQ
ncbi:MAG: Cna B-type domain-containing protein, partial [bacterium]|nr:Cna B-type domain-containing protein [bacterium]